ncbi:hypothetical protein D3C71_1884400 [compost metagenome]
MVVPTWPVPCSDAPLATFSVPPRVPFTVKAPANTLVCPLKPPELPVNMVVPASISMVPMPGDKELMEGVKT